MLDSRLSTFGPASRCSLAFYYGSARSNLGSPIRRRRATRAVVPDVECTTTHPSWTFDDLDHRQPLDKRQAKLRPLAYSMLTMTRGDRSRLFAREGLGGRRAPTPLGAA